MYGKNNKPLTIGIDYDDTITANHDLFSEVIALFKRFGCTVYIVTARNDRDFSNMLKKYEEKVDKIIFSNTVAKQDIVNVDIWIDDFPLSITHSWKEYCFSPGEKIKQEKWIKA